MKNDQSIELEVSVGTIVKVVSLLILFWIIYYLRDLVLIILTSVVIASAIEPITVWFTRWMIPRVPAVIIIYVLALAILFGLMLWFFPLVFDDFFRLANNIPEYISSISFDEYMSPSSAVILDRYKDSLIGSLSFEDVLPIVGGVAVSTSDGVFQTAKYFFGSMASFILMVIISFYLAVQERGIENFLRLVSNVKYEKYIIDLWGRSQRKIGYWMQGQILLGLLIGIFVFLGLSTMGVRYPLALAIFASIFEIIPVFGPILAAAPGVLVAFTQGTTLGLMTLGFYIIIQQFENHLIYPLVVRKVVGVPPLLVVLGILVGLQLAGIWGAILSVPAAAVLMELVSDYEQRKKLFSERGDS